MSRKRKGKAEKENGERWLITYSDLITLLMIFFIIMFAMSEISNQKFTAIASSLNIALGGSEHILPGAGPSAIESNPASPIQVQQIQKEAEQLRELQKELQDLIEKKNLTGHILVSIEERGLVVSFLDPVLFPLGSAQLTPKAKNIVQEVGQILLKSDNYIRIEGHTDDIPINTAIYPSNWELSAARATSVVQELIKTMSFPPERLAATGYGEYRPRVPNDSMDHKQMNRRVDIVVVRSKYEQSEPMILQTEDQKSEGNTTDTLIPQMQKQENKSL
jgi:chemotaxis protein MotB